MDRERMIDVLKMDRDLALFDPTTGECRPTNELNAESAEALDMAIKELEGKDINVPTNSALDHIHNVVRDDAYRRGYEQGKADAKAETIPVDWIEEYIDAAENVDGFAAKFIVAAITGMVEAWKIENKYPIDEGKADQNEGS